MNSPDLQDPTGLPRREEGKGSCRRPDLWRRLSTVMELVIFGLLIVVAWSFFGPELDRRAALQAEERRAALIRNERQQEVLRLRQEHRLLKTDKEYLETVARDRLNLQREGEFVIRLDRSEEGRP